LLIYVLPLKQIFIKSMCIWDLINWFNSATCFACPKPGHGFPTSYAMVFFYSVSERGEVILRFVDYGGIFYNHILSFSNFLLFFNVYCVDKLCLN